MRSFVSVGATGPWRGRTTPYPPPAQWLRDGVVKDAAACGRKSAPPGSTRPTCRACLTCSVPVGAPEGPCESLLMVVSMIISVVANPRAAPAGPEHRVHPVAGMVGLDLSVGVGPGPDPRGGRSRSRHEGLNPPGRDRATRCILRARRTRLSGRTRATSCSPALTSGPHPRHDSSGDHVVHRLWKQGVLLTAPSAFEAPPAVS